MRCTVRAVHCTCGALYVRCTVLSNYGACVPYFRTSWEIYLLPYGRMKDDLTNVLLPMHSVYCQFRQISICPTSCRFNILMPNVLSVNYLYVHYLLSSVDRVNVSGRYVGHVVYGLYCKYRYFVIARQVYTLRQTLIDPLLTRTFSRWRVCWVVVGLLYRARDLHCLSSPIWRVST